MDPNQKNTTWKRIEAALISIAIGTAISVITILAQELLGWLKELQPAVPGVIAGYLKFIHSWKSGRFA